MVIQQCSEIQSAWLQEVLNSYVTDAEAQQRLTELAVTSPDDHGYTLVQGVIHLRGRVWIGANSALDETDNSVSLQCGRQPLWRSRDISTH
jgi:hypothetical protein